MKQAEVAKWLKAITLLTGFAGLLFFFVIVPVLAEEMREMYPEVHFLYWPGLIYAWVVAAGCYGILGLFWKVCREIGNDNSFSKENARAFANMSRIAVCIAILWLAGMLFLAFGHWLNPGIMIFMLIAQLISFAVAVLTAALSHLILKAYELKRENDLTI